jgi:hypothetical protein
VYNVLFLFTETTESLPDRPAEKFKLNSKSAVNDLALPTEYARRSKGLKIPSFYKTYFDFLNTSKEHTASASFGVNILNKIAASGEYGSTSTETGDTIYGKSLDEIGQDIYGESSVYQPNDMTARDENSAQFETYAQKTGTSSGFAKAER